jgi:hypothetical protein
MKHLVKTLRSLLPDNGPYPEVRRAIFPTTSSLKNVFNIILSYTYRSSRLPISDGFLIKTVHAHRDIPSIVPV